jgi:hypothetical protein
VGGWVVRTVDAGGRYQGGIRVGLAGGLKRNYLSKTKSMVSVGVVGMHGKSSFRICTSLTLIQAGIAE